MRLTIEEVVTRYKDRIFAATFSICQNCADAEDAVQETFLKYYGTKKEFDDEAHLRAWLMRVAVNKAKDIGSSFWKRNTTGWEDYMETLEFEQPQDSQVFEAVMKLPQKYRIVIHLFYYEDYSVREIAGIVKLPEGTVKSQLNRGRLLLKNQLKEEE